MHAGVVLACDTPKALMAARGTDESGGGVHRLHRRRLGRGEARGTRRRPSRSRPRRSPRQTPQGEHPAAQSAFKLGRLLAYSRRETLEILPRPGAARVRVRRLVGPDAGVRVRDHDRRREHPLCRPGPRPDAGEPGLPRRVRGFAVVPPPAADPAASGKRNSGCGRTTSRWRSRCRRSSAATSNETRVRRSPPWSTAPTRSAPRRSSSTSPA